MHQSTLSPGVGGLVYPGGFDIFSYKFGQIPRPGSICLVKFVIHVLYFIPGNHFGSKKPSHGKGYFVNSPGYAWPLPWGLTLTGALV